MLSKILSTATLAVVAWLAVQNMQTQRALHITQGSFQKAIGELRSELDDVADQNETIGTDMLARMEQLSAQQVKLAKNSSKADPKLLKAKDQKITRLNQHAALQDVYANVLKADLLGTQKQGEAAAEMLLSTKTTIWKTSEKWEQSKDALRGLMAPIDILAGRWKRGDFKGDTKKIQAVLVEALSAQPKS